VLLLCRAGLDDAMATLGMAKQRGAVPVASAGGRAGWEWAFPLQTGKFLGASVPSEAGRSRKPKQDQVPSRLPPPCSTGPGVPKEGSSLCRSPQSMLPCGRCSAAWHPGYRGDDIQGLTAVVMKACVTWLCFK